MTLLTRAADLLRPLRFDLALELETARTNLVFDVHAATDAVDAVAGRAEAADDDSGAMIARAFGLFVRSYGPDVFAIDEVEALCRSALPVEEERGDPRRLALLWELLAGGANLRARNDACVDACRQELRYRRLAGDSPSDTLLDWSLLMGSCAADEGLRILDEVAADRPPGSADLARAALLAMLDRFDEAWPLAEARSRHLSDVSGGSDAGYEYLALIATIEGDRERACRHTVELLETFPVGIDRVAATYWLQLARQLCYLGRFEEAEPLVRQAQAVGLGPATRAFGATIEALLSAARGELEQAEMLAREGIAVAEAETDSPWRLGSGYEDLATVLERSGRIDDARDALESALAVWERKQCLPHAARVRSQLERLGRGEWT